MPIIMTLLIILLSTNCHRFLSLLTQLLASLCQLGLGKLGHIQTLTHKYMQVYKSVYRLIVTLTIVHSLLEMVTGKLNMTPAGVP